jgi:tetratricopeptide (TPR) repeat protein
MNYPSSVAVTWKTTMDQLHTPERDLLNVLAWFAPEPIPLSVLEGWSVQRAKARDALVELVSWSLARWTVDKDAFTIHLLVQEITRGRLSEDQKGSSLMSRVLHAVFTIYLLVQEITRGRLSEDQKVQSLMMRRVLPVMRQGLGEWKKAAALIEALVRVGKGLPDPAWNEAGWRLWERLAPHVRVLLRQVEGNPTEFLATTIMSQYGVWLDLQAQYSEAEPLLKRVSGIWEKALGPRHPAVPTSLNNLAEFYRRQGEYAQAEPLFQRALAITKKSFGPEHPNVAIRLNNLARLLRDTNRLGEAEPLYRRALAIDEKSPSV